MVSWQKFLSMKHRGMGKNLCCVSFQNVGTLELGYESLEWLEVSSKFTGNSRLGSAMIYNKNIKYIILEENKSDTQMTF